MTPEKFKQARVDLGLTQGQLAKILGRDPSTIRRYEMGGEQKTKIKIDPTVIKVMRWMIDGFRPPEWPNP